MKPINIIEIRVGLGELLSISSLSRYSFDVGSPKTFRKAGATSSVKSLACKLRPFFANASLEHSCQTLAIRHHVELGQIRLTLVNVLPANAARARASTESISPS